MILEEQKIEKDYRDLVGKNMYTKSHEKHNLLQRIFKNKSESLLFLKEIRFDK